jgi:LacI family transcriptional regulator
MTTRELARLAGVSQATISLALRNHPRISSATKTRVARLVRKHHYVVDGRVSELMRSIRNHATGPLTGCLGLISLYPEESPWLPRVRSSHLLRLYKGMVKRAGELGYRLEPFWVRNPDMSLDRLSSIIEARGIQGLLSLGAQDLEDEIPAELRRYTIVTLGHSIATALDRIVSHSAHNTSLLLTKIKERGYRRPGVVLRQLQDGRNGHIVAGMYLYFSHYVFGTPDIPILYSGETLEPAALNQWFGAHRPDVIVYADHGAHYGTLNAFFKKRRLVVPKDVGLAMLEAAVNPEGISGVRQNFEQMAISAVDMLVSRLQLGEVGMPRVPKVECVEGDWIEGPTLRTP